MSVFQIFHVAPKEDLIKIGYKTNKIIENLGILLHASKTL
jgi:hypothetical protein